MATYTVRGGDNLSRIAKKYNVSVSAIVKANGISNPNLIKPGQKLSIPRSTAQSRIETQDVWDVIHGTTSGGAGGSSPTSSNKATESMGTKMPPLPVIGGQSGMQTPQSVRDAYLEGMKQRSSSPTIKTKDFSPSKTSGGVMSLGQVFQSNNRPTSSVAAGTKPVREGGTKPTGDFMSLGVAQQMSPAYSSSVSPGIKTDRDSGIKKSARESPTKPTDLALAIRQMFGGGNAQVSAGPPATLGRGAQTPEAMRQAWANMSPSDVRRLEMGQTPVDRTTGDVNVPWSMWVDAVKQTGTAGVYGELPDFLTLAAQKMLEPYGYSTTNMYSAGYDLAYDENGVPYWYKTDRGGSASAAGGYAGATNARYKTSYKSSRPGSTGGRTSGSYIGSGMLVNWRI